MSEKDIERARLAQNLLNNPLLEEILSDLKQSYIDDWLVSNPKDVETRERLFMAARLIDQFRTSIKAVIDNGVVSAAIIEKRQKREDRGNL